MEKGGNPNTGSQNLQVGHGYEIQQRKMCHSHNEKKEMRIIRLNTTIKRRKTQNARRKGNIKIIGNIRIGHY